MTALDSQRLLGLLAAAVHVIPLGLMQPKQRWYNRHNLCPRRDKQTIAMRFWRAIQWWRLVLQTPSGVFLGTIHNQVSLTIDTSLQGWEAVLNQSRGPWCMVCTMDNSSHQCTGPQGGSPCTLTFSLSTERTTCTDTDRQHNCGCTHQPPGRVEVNGTAPGVLRSERMENQAADLLSRGGPLPSDWRIHPTVVEMICLQCRNQQAHSGLTPYLTDGQGGCCMHFHQFPCSLMS